jgi:hypothetical protein
MTNASDTSLSELGSVVGTGGSSWTSIVVTYYQTNIESTDIYFYPGMSNNDTDIIDAVKYSKSLGLSVVLKPVSSTSSSTSTLFDTNVVVILL